MNFKKTWNMQNGCDAVITKDNSSLSLLEVDMLKLSIGESKAYAEAGKEYSLIILGGKCTVQGDGFDYKGIGRRKNVFDGPATALYIPANRKFTVKADTDVSIAVCKSPSDMDAEPVLVNPGDVIIKDLGKDGWERQAHFIIDERINAKHIYIGEAYVASGMWASYPPHKHDEENMPTEASQEEIYYYEFGRDAGFGIQKVYSKEGDIDETYTVKTGDIVEIPRGYHPFCCAPGYNSYYLWIMAGKDRGFYMTTEEDHKWLVG
jgi:5-deoxy-glucuronate isomerase